MQYFSNIVYKKNLLKWVRGSRLRVHIFNKYLNDSDTGFQSMYFVISCSKSLKSLKAYL